MSVRQKNCATHSISIGVLLVLSLAMTGAATAFEEKPEWAACLFGETYDCSRGSEGAAGAPSGGEPGGGGEGEGGENESGGEDNGDGGDAD